MKGTFIFCQLADKLASVVLEALVGALSLPC